MLLPVAGLPLFHFLQFTRDGDGFILMDASDGPAVTDD